MKKRTKYNFDGTIYVSRETAFYKEYATAADIALILKYAVNDSDLVGNSKGVYLYNIPCAFDIETTSFYRDSDGVIYDYKQRQKLPKNAKIEKLGIMYVWQLGINGYIILGRTWETFLKVVNYISDTLKLNENRRLVIYIHNLSFEFQFICKLFTWQKVFAIDLRKPIYAITNTGIEFRCSYLLSGYSLETLGKNLIKYKVNKLVGDLDYTLLRHEKTPLTPKEIEYCVNDIKVVMLYILEYIENVKNLHNIPLTKTGGVRKFCRKNCFYVNTADYKGVNWNYKHLINELTVKDLTEFNTIQRAFAGGFTHANANHADNVLIDVASYDFTSSYPYVMISEKYPMSKGVKINIKSDSQFKTLLDKYLSVFDIEFTNIFATQTFENYISVSKCFVKENYSENNGRLICAKRIVTTITNIDFNIIKNLYSWDSYRVGVMYCYRKEYLPTEFVKSIIDLYKKKTELKGVQGMENEYLNSKEMLNSCYGMCVTNPLRNEYTFNDSWECNELSEPEQLEALLQYNLNMNRFLYYIWGVFVTAYARRNLFTAIFELKNDYVYSDTDSVKFLNKERHENYFKAYNYKVELKLKAACNFHGINFDSCHPKTIKGKEKMLGVWDFEGVYNKFKTLGAKRYMVKEANALTVNGKSFDYSLTVSGVNKKTAIPYLLEKYGESGIFEAFSNYLMIPETATGKNILTYIDYETNGTITDYTGKECEFNCKSGIHFEPTNYTLSLAVQYIQYISKLKILNNV